MKIVKFKSIFLFFILLVFSSIATAHTEESNQESKTISLRKIDRVSWKNTIKKLDYTEPTKKKTVKKNTTPVNFDFDLFDGWGNVAKYFFYAAVFFLLGFVIYFLYKKIDRTSNKKLENKTIALENIEDELQESDLDKFLRQALENGDYKLAIRIFYLSILKLLSEKKLIEWKKNKANIAYLIEMKKYQHFETFGRLTLVFEKIWYGDTYINKEDYELLAIEFDAYQKTIQKQSTT